MSDTIQPGQPVPDFSLPSSDGTTFTLSEHKGKKVVVYFYPKDLTPSCTNEACDFRDLQPAFAARNAVVVGISPDPVKTHRRFAEKYGLPFPLLSDPDHKVAESFGVWTLKKMYGREYMGIERSTFLIDEEGRLEREWRKVRVKAHAEGVLNALG